MARWRPSPLLIVDSADEGHAAGFKSARWLNRDAGVASCVQKSWVTVGELTRTLFLVVSASLDLVGRIRKQDIQARERPVAAADIPLQFDLHIGREL